MKPREILPGTRLEIELINRREERLRGPYISQLLEFTEDGCLVVSVPISRARLIYLPPEGMLSITFLHPTEGPMQFAAKVKSREYRNRIAVMILEPVEPLTRIQRRSYYRLKLIQPAYFRPACYGAEEETVPLQKAILKNISGSGLCLLSDTDHTAGTDLDVELLLSEGTRLKTRCVVTWNRPLELKKGLCYELGLHFTVIDQKDRDWIIKYIFEQQRAQLKRDTR